MWQVEINVRRDRKSPRLNYSIFFLVINKKVNETISMFHSHPGILQVPTPISLEFFPFIWLLNWEEGSLWNDNEWIPPLCRNENQTDRFRFLSNLFLFIQYTGIFFIFIKLLFSEYEAYRKFQRVYRGYQCVHFVIGFPFICVYLKNS